MTVHSKCPGDRQNCGVTSKKVGRKKHRVKPHVWGQLIMTDLTKMINMLKLINTQAGTKTVRSEQRWELWSGTISWDLAAAAARPNLSRCLNFFFSNLYIYIYLFGCVDLRYCTVTCFGCGQWWLLSSWGAGPSHWGGFSCCRAQALRHVGFSSRGCKLSCSTACGIFPERVSNPRLLHWQADS